MSHAYYKIWIHTIFGTKNRLPLLHHSIEQTVYEFINDQFREQDCLVNNINGMPDHVHCLFLLNPNKSIAEIMKQIKGSSSHFINRNNLINEKFAWQIGYAAFTVSESGIDRVSQYISNQKSHHQKKSFQQEYEEFIKIYGL
jgi:REP element-mobilizing transposase RayT